MPKGTTILMVDDDKMLIDMYKERLELAGYKVEISRDGEEGLAKIHQVKPDIVLLDIMMPKVNGYEALAAIKSDPATKDIPVIILSALMRDINKTKAVEAGADDYIIKSEAMPVDVIKKVEAVLTKYHKGFPTVSSTPLKPESPIPEIKPPAPIAASEIKPTPEIEFQPQAQAVPAAVSTPPVVPMVAPLPTPASPAKTGKTNPVIIFFLILIVMLILASDIFFYLQYSISK